MKELFLYLREKIMQSGVIRWVDLDKGQVDDYEVRPAIDFPAVLLSITYPQTANQSRKLQKCDVTIMVRIVFDFVDDTSSITPESTLMASLECFDTVKNVHDALQGQIDKIFKAPLARGSQRDENRPTGLKIFNVPYTTWLHEETA